METVAEKTVARYKTIKTVINVKVKIPRPGTQMKLVSVHSFESANGPVDVPTHWQNGVVVQNHPLEIVNRHFYVEKEDLGKKIRATVEVVEKTVVEETTGKEKTFIILNYRPYKPAPGDPILNITFKEGTEPGIPIPRTNFQILFI